MDTAESEIPPTMLASSSVCGYLVQRGVLAGGTEPDRIVELGGGVSNLVFLVEAGSKRLVVKQARGRLLVEQEWLADTARALSEADALEFAQRVTPGAVPEVVDVDPEAYALTMTAAPSHWGTWKEALLAGAVDPEVGRRVGNLAGRWHLLSATSEMAALDGLSTFWQLRIDPYHRSVASRHPDLAGQIATAVAQLTDEPNRRCLVHGDLSPKNVLVGDDTLWVIDFEVAHRGNPVFDVAFLLTHLVLKSIHRPADVARYRECAAAFLDGYAAVTSPRFVPLDDSLGLQIGCLLLARVDGKSPAEYLDAVGRKAAREIGRALVREPLPPEEVWRLVGPSESR